MTQYSVLDHGRMVDDRVRMDAYDKALRRTVFEGAIVLDIGTGSGIFALLACRYGAERVYAVEPEPIIGLARQLAQANGFADRIVFFNGRSTEMEVPRRADILVSDLRGVLPVHTGSAHAIRDARSRLLRPDPILIPEEDSLWIALVELPEEHQDRIGPWKTDHRSLDLSAGRSYTFNEWSKVWVDEDALLMAPVQWGDVEYARFDDADLRGGFRGDVRREGIAHGLLAWFDTRLTRGVGFSNGPGGPRTIYGQGFFPLGEAIETGPGDAVFGEIRADNIRGQYLWSWDARIVRGESERVVSRSRHSTFLAGPKPAEALAVQARDHVPSLDTEAEVARFFLDRADGRASLVEIAEALHGAYPDRYADPQDAMAAVAELSRRFSRRL